MKKILFAAALAGAAILTACGDKGGGVRMGSLSEFDSLSYVLGANIGNGINFEMRVRSSIPESSCRCRFILNSLYLILIYSLLLQWPD